METENGTVEPLRLSLLGLHQIKGEVPVEEVFWRGWHNYDFYVKRETPSSGWEWVVMHDQAPLEFGDGQDFDDAETKLAEFAFGLEPDLMKEIAAQDEIEKSWRVARANATTARTTRLTLDDYIIRAGFALARGAAGALASLTTRFARIRKTYGRERDRVDGY